MTALLSISSEITSCFQEQKEKKKKKKELKDVKKILGTQESSGLQPLKSGGGAGGGAPKARKSEKFPAPMPQKSLGKVSTYAASQFSPQTHFLPSRA